MSVFDWQEYLSLARDMIETGSADEACLRSSMSRAYYAAFHAARDYVENRIGPVPTREAHEFVWRSLQSGKNSKPRAGSRGIGLRKTRNDADYEDEFKGQLQSAATKAISDAELIINETRL